MNADKRRYLDSLTEKIIGCAYEVSNTLGAGFLEKVYENAAQCLNYLKATNKNICLLINFGSSKVDIKRIVNKIKDIENPRSSAFISG